MGNCLDRRLRGLNAFRLASAPQPSTEEATGTSRNPGDLLVSGSGYKNIITKDLMDDPLLTIENMRYFQKISKEMYKFTLVRHDCSSAIMPCQVACLLSLPLIQDVAKCSQEKSEKLKAVESGLRELQVKDRRISEEQRSNIYLQRELDKLKQERTREIWLLKNDLCNLEKSNSELQEQLKEQKKAHQGKSFARSSTFS
jgi:hypothetical protein